MNKRPNAPILHSEAMMISRTELPKVEFLGKRPIGVLGLLQHVYNQEAIHSYQPCEASSSLSSLRRWAHRENDHIKHCNQGGQ